MNEFPMGKINWIGIRPLKGSPLHSIKKAAVDTVNGLNGDHYCGKSGKRQLTLINQEDLKEVAQTMGKNEIDPELTRRNVVFSGKKILPEGNALFRIGDEVIIKITGPCRPCKRMDENLGEGGEEAMKGRGGLTAKIVKDGYFSVGDKIFQLSDRSKES